MNFETFNQTVHEKGISVLKNAAWSNQQMQLKVLASLLQIEVPIWSAF